MKLYVKYIVLICFFLQSTTNYAQVIIRLWEAELSAGINVAALKLIIPAETKVREEMGKLNTELRKQIPYYGYSTLFDKALGRDTTVRDIRAKVAKLSGINNKVPRLFNSKKKQRTRQLAMYTDYLNSLDKDITSGFANNGNLLKTSIEIVSELEEIERDLDDTLEDLTIAERLSNLFL